MAKTKVKIELNGPLGELLKGSHLSSEFKSQMGFKVVEDMKQFMSAGQSPVKGVGRFEAYSTQRNKDPKKRLYPFNVKKEYPGKQVRPVNLKLSGDLYDSIDYRVIQSGVQVGHFSPSKDIREKFEKHNLGTDPRVPKRQYLPGQGQTFNVSIMRNLKELVISRIKSILRRK